MHPVGCRWNHYEIFHIALSGVKYRCAVSARDRTPLGLSHRSRLRSCSILLTYVMCVRQAPHDEIAGASNARAAASRSDRERSGRSWGRACQRSRNVARCQRDDGSPRSRDPRRGRPPRQGPRRGDIGRSPRARRTRIRGQVDAQRRREDAHRSGRGSPRRAGRNGRPDGRHDHMATCSRARLRGGPDGRDEQPAAWSRCSTRSHVRIAQ